MDTPVENGGPVFNRSDLEHLLVPADSLCWWCQLRPADSGEHKVKRTDLARMMGEGDELIWVTPEGELKSIRGKSGIKRDRHKVVKFPRSLCSRCNNEHSQPFDRAYDIFASYLYANPPGAHLDFTEIYGDAWSTEVPNLARYFAKHFGCRMGQAGLPIPQSLRDFMNGVSDMTDAQMCFIENEEIPFAIGEFSGNSDDTVLTDHDRSCLNAYILVCYFGRYGVRYEWFRDGIADEKRNQFFHYRGALIHLFKNEDALLRGRPSKRGLWTRFLQWVAS